MIRKAAVLGQFYPSSENEVQEMLSSWQKSEVLPGCSAVIVPHAGYVFSGECAFKALSAMDLQNLKRVVIVGPSHNVGFSGLSLFVGDQFETVGGMHAMDRGYAERLREKFSIPCYQGAHAEHSTEVQVPLIAKLAPTLPVVECVYGSDAMRQLTELLFYLQENPYTGIIISSDLSHYHNETVAHNVDKHVECGVRELNPRKVQMGEGCGLAGIKALLHVCKDGDKHVASLDYRTSADSPYGDRENVVGYLSATFL